MQSLKPQLRIHELVPLFMLPSSQGREVKLWDYKMRKNLIILFYHGGECSWCREELKMFAENYGELVELETEILAISSGGLDRSRSLSVELALPYPLLSDPEGRVIEKYTYWRQNKKAAVPSIFVTDRYGALYYQCIVKEITELPERAEILSWLNFIQSQCPECSI